MNDEFPRNWLPVSAALFVVLALAFVGSWMAALYAANEINGMPNPEPGAAISVFLIFAVPAVVAAITLARLFRPTASAMWFRASRTNSSMQELARRYLEQRRAGQ